MNSLILGTSAPLSFAQQEVWLHTQFGPGVPLDNKVLVLGRKGPINRQALEQSLSEIIRRHPTLRTTFAIVDGSPAQIIMKYKAAELLLIDLSGLPNEQREAEVLQITGEETRCSFDLAEGPLMRARLVQLCEQEYLLIIALHSIVADECSLNVLAHELDALFEAYSAGKQSPLADLPFHYTDYAHQQRSRFQGDVLNRDTSYWRERFACISPVLELPADRPRSNAQGSQAGRQSVVFSNHLSDSLLALSEQEGVTLFATMLAAFQALLSRYTGQDDIVLGSIVSGRDRIETRNLIGPFAHTIVFRTDLGDDPAFRELQRRVRDGLRADCEHQNMPFDCLLNDFQPDRDSGGSPLYRVLFSLTPEIANLRSGWEPANFEGDFGIAKVDLQLQLYEGAKRVIARFTYNADLFDAATIGRMAGQFQSLLEGIVANPDECISKLPLLTPAERHQLLVEWNETRMDYSTNRCVHHLFEEQVSRTPHATAVVFESQQLTYQQLNDRANRLAHQLLKLGVGPDALVGICTERCPDMVAGLLGILKSGGAYVPLDPQYPSERLSLMLEDSGLKVLVTRTPLRPKFSEYKGELVCLDSESICGEEGAENCSGGAKPGDLAYAIYTSGSTGKPKGVQILHRSLVNFLVSMQSSPGLTADDTLLAVTTISFDIAALELYLPLIVGARLLLASRETAGDGYRLHKLLATNAPTVMQATPATWRLLLEAGWQRGGNLKILCGGEALPRDLALELLKRASSLWNMYGPTETTVWSTTCRITSDEGPITIGRPIGNTDVYVLDRHLEPVPVGIPGELYIGGDGVARGYLHRPELTAEKFIPHPFRGRESESRLYRTGDLARYRANGELECIGRTDNQVKVRGFRIELGEIESVLSEYPGVKQSVVVAREDTPGDRRLVAYLVFGPQQSAAADTLRKFLKQKLPDYMLPSRFVFLDSFPLTPNGKIDRKALPKPDQMESLHQEENHVARQGQIESQLGRIWESVLGIRRVGVNESFFELGGHSLLVPKLLRGIEQAFGKQLSMATIFEAPTIEQQASVLQNDNGSRWPSALLPVQPAGSKPPFFCFGYAAGPVFLPLARRLGHEQPLIGVDPLLLEASHFAAPYKMEDVAACLAKQIRELHPTGPYYLGGFCGGGLVAYATASELMAQGQKVGMLALFEPHTSYYNWHSSGSRNASRMRVLKFHVENLQAMELKETPAYIRHRARVHSVYLGGVFMKALDALRPHARSGRQPDIRNILTIAYRGYRAQPFAGPVALFHATHREPGGEWERQYWAELATTLDVYEIPGYSNWLPHFFLEPSVGILANNLQDRLG